MFSDEYWRGVKVFVVAGTLLGAALWDGRRGGGSFAGLGSIKRRSVSVKGTKYKVVEQIDKDWVLGLNDNGNYVVMNKNPHTKRWDELEWHKQRQEGARQLRSRYERNAW